MGLFDKVKDTISGDGQDDEAKEQSDDSSATGSLGKPPEGYFEDRVSVPKRTEIIIEHYDGVTGKQAKVIAETLKEHLEQDGHNVDEIRYELEDELDLDDELIHTIVWTETSSINVTETINQYLENQREDDLYKISVSDDGHEICTTARDEIVEQGGVTLEELTQILIEKAEEHPDGTPERMEHWVPHERCKHTVTKHYDF